MQRIFPFFHLKYLTSVIYIYAQKMVYYKQKLKRYIVILSYILRIFCFFISFIFT